MVLRTVWAAMKLSGSIDTECCRVVVEILTRASDVSWAALMGVVARGGDGGDAHRLGVAAQGEEAICACGLGRVMKWTL